MNAKIKKFIAANFVMLTIFGKLPIFSADKKNQILKIGLGGSAAVIGISALMLYFLRACNGSKAHYSNNSNNNLNIDSNDVSSDLNDALKKYYLMNNSNNNLNIDSNDVSSDSNDALKKHYSKIFGFSINDKTIVAMVAEIKNGNCFEIINVIPPTDNLVDAAVKCYRFWENINPNVNRELPSFRPVYASGKIETDFYIAAKYGNDVTEQQNDENFLGKRSFIWLSNDKLTINDLGIKLYQKISKTSFPRVSLSPEFYPSDTQIKAVVRQISKATEENGKEVGLSTLYEKIPLNILYSNISESDKDEKFEEYTTSSYKNVKFIS
jgi:hypothetical protein